MAGWVCADKVGAYSLTSGTGTYTTEATQPVGFQHLNTVLANVGDYAFIRTEAGSDFEVAILTKTGSQTFARTEIIESTNADAAVSWPVGATMAMALVVPADDFKAYDREDFLINGNGQVAQQTLGSVTDDSYTNAHDQWYGMTQTAALTASQLTDVEDGLPQMMRLTQGQASAQRIGYAQILEGQRCKKLRGKRVAFGGRLRYSNAAAVRFAILEWTGTVDAVTSDVVNDWTNGTFTAGNFFNSTTLTVRAVGTLTPSAATLTDFRLSAVLGSSFNNLILMVWTEGTAAQNSTLDFAAQLKKGFIAAPLGFRHYDTERTLCRRYWRKLLVIQGQAEGTTQFNVQILHEGMRAAPTVALSAAARINRAGGNFDQSAAQISAVGGAQDADRGLYTFGNFTGLTDGAAYLWRGTTVEPTADARL